MAQAFDSSEDDSDLDTAATDETPKVAPDSEDEFDEKRVFVKPRHLVVQARDVDTDQGWAELLQVVLYFTQALPPLPCLMTRHSILTTRLPPTNDAAGLKVCQVCSPGAWAPLTSLLQ